MKELERQLLEALNKYMTGEKGKRKEVFILSCQDLYIYAMFLMKKESKALLLLCETYKEAFKALKETNKPDNFMLVCKKIMYEKAFVLYPLMCFQEYILSEAVMDKMQKNDSSNRALKAINMSTLAQQHKYYFDCGKADWVYQQIDCESCVKDEGILLSLENHN